MGFNTYTSVYDLITFYLERFQDKWAAYKVYLEPFLEGSEDIIGMFSELGLFIFFYLDQELPGRYRVEDSKEPNILRVTVNPNNFIKINEFEMLLLKYILKFNSFKGRMSKCLDLLMMALN